MNPRKPAPVGFAAPTPCPGGTYSNAFGLATALSCISVVADEWAPTGSQFPEACPASGFKCPGRADDKDNAVPGSKPILVGSGQASVDVEVEKVTFDLLVNIDPDEYDEAEEYARARAARALCQHQLYL